MAVKKPMKACPSCHRKWPADQTACPIDGYRLDDSGETQPDPAADTLASSPGRADTEPIEDNELIAGTMVGEYRIERCIGIGGMGVVYGAVHPVIGKRVAIKVLTARYSADRSAVERFVIEAQSVNQIGHANIVDIFAFGMLPDRRSYCVMEWLKGETLADRLERGPLSSIDQLTIVDEIAQTLEAAHAAGVIHRDLKPENIVVLERSPTGGAGDALKIKLLDFGIAK